MKPEYILKIALTEHTHDNYNKPFYWSILKYDTSWHQIAFNWEETVEKCFISAMNYYSQLTFDV